MQLIDVFSVSKDDYLAYKAFNYIYQAKDNLVPAFFLTHHLNLESEAWLIDYLYPVMGDNGKKLLQFFFEDGDLFICINSDEKPSYMVNFSGIAH